MEALRRSQAAAIRSNEIENLYRSKEEIAFNELMIELRVPTGPVRRMAEGWLLDFMMQSAS